MGANSTVPHFSRGISYLQKSLPATSQFNGTRVCPLYSAHLIEFTVNSLLKRQRLLRSEDYEQHVTGSVILITVSGTAPVLFTNADEVIVELKVVIPWTSSRYVVVTV